MDYIFFLFDMSGHIRESCEPTLRTCLLVVIVCSFLFPLVYYLFHPYARRRQWLRVLIYSLSSILLSVIIVSSLIIYANLNNNTSPFTKTDIPFICINSALLGLFVLIFFWIVFSTIPFGQFKLKKYLVRKSFFLPF